jgi:hypothetical protein
MPLESGTTINALDATWPLQTDPTSQGDDHLRLLKNVLKLQFPGAGGGLDAPVNVTADEFNNLQGSTGNIQAQLDNKLDATSGTAGDLRVERLEVTESATIAAEIVGSSTIQNGTVTNLNSSTAFITAATIETLNIGQWSITLAGNDLVFLYGGQRRFRLATTGAITVTNNVTGFGTP